MRRRLQRIEEGVQQRHAGAADGGSEEDGHGEGWRGARSSNSTPDGTAHAAAIHRCAQRCCLYSCKGNYNGKCNIGYRKPFRNTLVILIADSG